MRLAGVASALPKHRYSQQALIDELKWLWAGKLEREDLLDRLHARVGVATRHLALPLEAYRDLLTFEQSNDAWIENAEELGATALDRALARAGLAPGELSALFFVSVTGIASPSIDARLVNRLRLSPNIRRVPIFGLGCVGGAAGIALAADHARAYPGGAAALVAVELCSLTLQRDDLSVANLISAGLFADGAAAVVVTGEERAASGPRILDTRSILYPHTEHVMGWDVSHQGFRIVLSREVPDMVYGHLARDVEAFLGHHGLTRDDVTTWILHPGGPAVLRAYAAVLDLPAAALESAWDCLREVGNLSSASVLVLLERVMERQRPAAGTFGLLAAMGPGFCSQLVLLEW